MERFALLPWATPATPLRNATLRGALPTLVDARLPIATIAKAIDDGTTLQRSAKKRLYEETFADTHGAEADFWASTGGHAGEVPLEDQPELEFIFSAGTDEEKEDFLMTNAETLQGYDAAVQAGEDAKAEKLLQQVKQKWKSR